MSNELSKETKEALLGCLSALVCLPLEWLLMVLATVNVWNGILAASFGIATIGFWQAVGLRLGLKVFRGVKVSAKIDDRENFKWYFSTCCFYALLCYGLSFLAVHLWNR